MQTEYTKLKVHNEIELCETSDMEVKQQIERVLLSNRISYCLKWYKTGIFRRYNVCVFCVNSNSTEVAEELILSIGEEAEDRIRFLKRKVEERYF